MGLHVDGRDRRDERHPRPHFSSAARLLRGALPLHCGCDRCQSERSPSDPKKAWELVGLVKAIDRFMSYVRKTDTCKVPGLPGGGCWLWIGGRRNKQGHGGFWLHGRTISSHVFSYEHFKGPLPKGYVPDHLCMTPPCVNPSHLEAVTQQVNTLRCPTAPAAINAKKTHCPKGHAYTPENLILTCGRRICRACHTLKLARFRKAHPDKMKQYKRDYRDRNSPRV